MLTLSSRCRATPILSGSWPPAPRREVAAVLRHFQGIRYLLHAYVVMDDYVHVLVELLVGTTLQTHSWKSFTANRLQKNSRGAVWQREYFDRIVRDDAEYAVPLCLSPSGRLRMGLGAGFALVAPAGPVIAKLIGRSRQWGACWLAGQLWRELQLDRFWADRSPN